MPQMNTKSGLRERVGYYAFGLAIGFMILGFFWWAKAQAKKQEGPNGGSPTAPATPQR